jgi:hypothetical protein
MCAGFAFCAKLGHISNPYSFRPNNRSSSSLSGEKIRQSREALYERLNERNFFFGAVPQYFFQLDILACKIHIESIEGGRKKTESFHLIAERARASKKNSVIGDCLMSQNGEKSERDSGEF